MTFITVVIAGRRNCSRCKRWRHIQDFPPRKVKGAVVGVNGVCHACRREINRSYSPKQRERNRISAKIHQRKKRRMAGVPEKGARSVKPQRHGRVRREPFARWLAETVEQHGVGFVSMRTGLNEREIWRLMKGYEPGGGISLKHRGKRKAAVVDYVEFDTVDEALVKWDDPNPNLLEEMYPPEPGLPVAPRNLPDTSSVPGLLNPIEENRRRRRGRKPRSG